MNALPHLMIADALWTRLQWDAPTRPFMLLGGIAPDAYRIATHLDHHALHFRSHHTEGRRLRDLLDTHLLPALELARPETGGFWLGWLSHVIGDTVWRRILRRESPELWDAGIAGSAGEKRQAREQYHADCDHADREIAEGPA